MSDTSEPLGAIPPDPTPLPEPPAYRLYTPDMIAGASFMGSALAGGYMMYVNSKRLNQGKGGVYLLVALALTALTLALAYLLPDGFPGTVLGLGALLAMRTYALSVQGAAVREHLSLGGRAASGWKVVGVVVVSCLLVLGSIAGVYVLALAPSTFHLGQDEILYQNGATQSEAKSLAEQLKKIGYFKDRGVSVYLSRPDGKLHVGMVVKQGAWDSDDTCKAFRIVGQEISKNAFGGAQIVVELTDASGEVKKTLTPAE